MVVRGQRYAASIGLGLGRVDGSFGGALESPGFLVRCPWPQRPVPALTMGAAT